MMTDNVIKINVDDNAQVLERVHEMTINDLERSKLDKRRAELSLEDIQNNIEFREEMVENTISQTLWIRSNVVINAIFLGCLIVILFKLS